MIDLLARSYSEALNVSAETCVGLFPERATIIHSKNGIRCQLSLKLEDEKPMSNQPSQVSLHSLEKQRSYGEKKRGLEDSAKINCT